jgi:V8-like Glu-specific endopeptidase
MGSIAGLRAKVKIQMPVLGGQVVVFRSMVLYNTHSEGGDSGAAVLDARDNSVVGLHVAGDGGLGTYLPIQQVLDALGVELF